MAELIPGSYDQGIIITSVSSIVKHYEYFNSLTRFKYPEDKVKSKDMMVQEFLNVPRRQKFIKKGVDREPIFDGTLSFTVKNRDNSYSFAPLTMLYLFETMKKCKIVLTFDDASTIEAQMNLVKDTFKYLSDSLNLAKK